jgi:hypothetical protein
MERAQRFLVLFGRKCCLYSDIEISEEIKAKDDNIEEDSHSKILGERAEFEKNEAILKITVLESNNIQPGKVFCIYPKALKECEKANAKDRCMYIGLHHMKNGKAVYGMLLSQSKKGKAKKDFVIQHNEGEYYLKSIDQGLGTYISLRHPFALITEKVYIISIGNIHVAVGIENYKQQTIVIQVVDGPNKNDKL